MVSALRRIERSWPLADEVAARTARDGLLLEVAVDDPDAPDQRFEQEVGPFESYERVVRVDDGRVVDVTTYRLALPWFGWLFRWPVRSALRRRTVGSGSPPPWAPPDRLNAHQVLVLGLLAAASLSAAFVNTLFTQTVNFAATEFGMSEQSQGVAGVIVRCGIVIALPFTLLADRVGRRRMIVLLAWLAPLCVATGALAPNFWVLTASQAIGRPLGIALDLLIAVVATEEMPRNSRAYALSILAMASGLGGGVAVTSLPLADLSTQGWRFVYVVPLIWTVVALDLSRRLPETARFDRARSKGRLRTRTIDRRRFAILGTVSFTANLFVASASYFQNRYLDDVRGYSAAGIALFTLTTATPAGFGFVVGGRIADTIGRRRVLAIALPTATGALVLSFLVGGWLMWVSAFTAGFVGGIAYPAFAVYRTELFPTGKRAQAGGLLATSALVGGSVGLLLTGWLVNRGWSYGAVMGLLALGQVLAATIVLSTYPETAHQTLEELNPGDD